MFEWVLNTPLEADAQKSYEKKTFSENSLIFLLQAYQL